MLSPRALIENAADLAYVNARNCEWKLWCYPATRLIGLAYVFIALTEHRKR